MIPTILDSFREAMYEGAQAMWPSLTREQFKDAALAWLSRQHGNLTIQAVAVGVEQELRDRFGLPGDMEARFGPGGTQVP